MKKNTRLLIFSACALAILSSCSKWLDVQPTDRVSDESLYEDANGFRTALNGIYQIVASPDLYGRSLTWGLNSAMANDYTLTKIPDELKSAANADLKNNNIQGLLSNTWGKAYTAIANCNKLIAEIDTKDDALFQLGKTEKNLIKGEAIALRAMLHFDLTRIFSPALISNSNEPFVPYQDRYPAPTAVALSTRDILKKVIGDLELAQSLVAENDTLTNVTYLSGGIGATMGGTTGANGIFFSFRMNRINFVAINTLLARVYLYAGEYDKAKKAAFFVYKNYGPEGKKWFFFTPEYLTNTLTRYQKLPEDLLLAFYDPKLLTNINAYRGTSFNFQLHQNYTAFFPGSERDFRRNLINTADNTSYKWTESLAQPAQNLILPAVRLSEAYYIYSECLYREGNTTEALSVFNKIRLARGRSTTFQDASENGYYSELLLEYRREYMTEGQTIFAYKRLNRPMILGSQTIQVSNRFTAPVPEGER